MPRAIVSLFLAALMSLYATICFGGQPQDLGQGWEFRVDRPTPNEQVGQWHVHVYKKGKEIGVEGVNGSPSHGQTLSEVPASVKEKLKNHPEYKKAQEEQKKLEEAKKQIKSKKLKLDVEHAADIAVAVAIVVAATATYFYPADDVPAWANLFRAIMAEE